MYVQGAERDIMILSTVRSSKLGFIDSARRLNVAITRAKRHLIIVGVAPVLRTNKLWAGVLQTCAKQTTGFRPVEHQQLGCGLLHAAFLKAGGGGGWSR